MELSYIIGLISILFSMIYRIPQIYKLHKTKSGKDLSMWMIHLQNTSYFFYLWYAYLDQDIIIGISTTISVLQNIYMIIFIYLTSLTSLSSGGPDSLPFVAESGPSSSFELEERHVST